MRISQRLARIKPSATLAINAKAQEMRAQGLAVVSLAVGEPDFPTPAHICEAAKEALDAGHTRYTPVPGIPELRDAVAGYYARFYGISPGRDETIVSNGGKQALYNLLMALLDEGDEVLVPAPYWVSYPAMVELAGGVCVPVPSEPDKGFLLDVAELEAKATTKTRALILNTPSNPTGCHYSQERVESIAAWAKANGIFVIADEVYDRLVFEPARPASLARFFERNPSDVAIVGALSKSFCMIGWRVGFALAHPDLVKAMTKIQGQSTSNVCSIAQRAALAALTGPYDILDEMKKAFVRRRDLALAIISGWDVPCPRPDGAFYLFPVLSRFYSKAVPDSAALCTKILEQAHVALVPGSAFGDDRCVRFSYALDDAVLESALRKVGGVLLGG